MRFRPGVLATWQPASGGRGGRRTRRSRRLAPASRSGYDGGRGCAARLGQGTAYVPVASLAPGETAPLPPRPVGASPAASVSGFPARNTRLVLKTSPKTRRGTTDWPPSGTPTAGCASPATGCSWPRSGATTALQSNPFSTWRAGRESSHGDSRVLRSVSSASTRARRCWRKLAPERWRSTFATSRRTSVTSHWARRSRRRSVPATRSTTWRGQPSWRSRLPQRFPALATRRVLRLRRAG